MSRQKLASFLCFLVPVATLTAVRTSGGTPQSQLQQGASGQNQSLPAPKEELLGEITSSAKIDKYFGGPFLSPDGRRFAIICKAGKTKWFVMIDGKPGPEFEEVRYEDNSRGPGVGPVFFSANSQHVAYAAHGGDKKLVVVLDGQPRPEQGEFSSLLIVFSPDSQHFGYTVKRGPKKWVRVVDGKEGPEFQNIELKGPLFSPDSQHIAYRAKTTEDKWVMMVDGQSGPEFEGDGVASFGSSTSGNSICTPDGRSFSPDSQHFAYTAKRGPKKCVMVIDGKEGPEFQQMLGPVFSPDSQHIAYRAKLTQDKWVMVVDGQPGPEFDAITEGWTFSPDGKHLAYKAKTGSNTWAIILDGKPLQQFDGIALPVSESNARLVQSPGVGELVFSPDMKYQCYPGVGELVFSPDGQHVSYVARRGEKLLVTQDGQGGPQFPFILSGPVFSPDSQHAVYVAWEQNTMTTILDGKTAKKIPIPEGLPLYTSSGNAASLQRESAWDNVAFLGVNPVLLPVGLTAELFKVLAAKSVNFVEHITFSPDGQHLAYVVGRGGHTFDGMEQTHAQRYVVVDGYEGRQYNADGFVHLIFSPDSRHFAFEVHKADQGKSFIVLDGQESKHYDELLSVQPGWRILQSTLQFQEDGSVTYLARDGRKFYRVTQPLP